MRFFVPSLIGLLLFISTNEAKADGMLIIEPTSYGYTFLSNETFKIKLTPLNMSMDSEVKLKAKVTLRDAYGRKRRCVQKFPPLRKATEADPALFAGHISFGAPLYCEFPNLLLGHYQISVTTIDISNHKKRVDSFQGAVVPPIDFKDDDNASLGYFTLDLPTDPSTQLKAAKQMASFGIKWVRFAFRGYDDSRTTVPDFSKTSWLVGEDQFLSQVSSFRKYGIQVMVQPFGSPNWASSFPNDSTYYISYMLGWQVAPPTSNAWSQILGHLADRLGDSVKYWEIWNEPESYIYFDPQAPTDTQRGQNYRSMLINASQVLKSKNPNYKTVVNPAGFSNSGWNNAVYASGISSSLDIFGAHYQSAKAPASIKSILENQYGLTGKQYWNTETFGHYEKTSETDGLTNVFPLHYFWQRASGVSRSFAFLYNNDFAPRYGQPVVNQNTYQPTLLGPAIRTVADKVGSAEAVKAFPYSGYTAFQFIKNGKLIVALSSETFIKTWKDSDPPTANITFNCVPSSQNFTFTDIMGNDVQLTYPIGHPSSKKFQVIMKGNTVFIEGFDSTCNPGLNLPAISSVR